MGPVPSLTQEHPMGVAATGSTTEKIRQEPTVPDRCAQVRARRLLSDVVRGASGRRRGNARETGHVVTIQPMSVTIPRAVLAAALVAACAPAADAQIRSASDEHVWVGLLGDYPVGRRLGLVQEDWLRRADAGATWQQVELLQGLAWAVVPRWRLAGGYTYQHNFPHGAFQHRATDENRAWVQSTLSHGLGRLRVAHRTRAELRWIGDEGTWTRAARVREQLRATLPMAHASYAFGGGESFIRVYPAGERYALEQTRFQVGVGRTVAHATSLELAYLEESLRRTHEREHNHTLAFTVRAGWRLR